MIMSMPRSPFAVAALIGAVLATPVLAKPSLGQKCAASKQKAVGTAQYAKAKCWQKALLHNISPYTDCLPKAEANLEKAFMEAETKGGCAVTGDISFFPAYVDATVTICLSEFGAPSKCSAAKVKACGKGLFDVAKCGAKEILAGVPNPDCTNAAYDRLPIAFAKADRAGPCDGDPGTAIFDIAELTSDVNFPVSTPTPTPGSPPTPTTIPTVACCQVSVLAIPSFCTDVVSASHCAGANQLLRYVSGFLTVSAAIAPGVCDGATGLCAPARTGRSSCCQVSNGCLTNVCAAG